MSKIDKLIENGIKSLMIENLEEKAVSKNQQQFMGMVHAYKKGEMKDAPASVKKAAKGMTKKAAKDFASTKHKGLPTRVDESVIGDILIIADENNTYEKFTAELIKQKYIMPDELEDPETEKELRAIYSSVTEAILKEYTDNSFSGAKVIADAKSKKPDSEDMEFIERYFPNAVKSMTKAEQNLRASDNSPIKKRMGQYAPMFVHVQYHTFEGDAGQTYSVHQTQYYNSNFNDQDPSFNPRVTKLYFSQKDPDEKMGVILATTDEYIKDLKDLERQGKLGKRVSESLNEALAPTNDLKSKMPDHVKGWAKWVAQHANGEWWYYDSIPRLVPGTGWKNNNRDGYQFGSGIKTAPQGWEKSSQELKESLNENKGQDAAIDLINKLRRTLYPKLSDLELEAFKNEMAQHLDATINESKMNTKTESIVKRLKEDTEYQKFFKSAMDKFGVKSPKELSDKKKKDFFNYVDKNYKAKSEALNEEFFAAHSSDSADTRKVITQLNNTFKSLQSQYNVPSRILDIAVDLVNQLVEQGYEDGRAEVEGML